MKISKSFHGLSGKKIVNASKPLSGSDFALFEDASKNQFLVRNQCNYLVIVDKSRTQILARVSL